MYNDQTVQKFIELRARAVSYDRIAAELNVTKPTLLAWSRKHQFQIQNLKTMAMEALAEQYLSSVQDRVKRLGEQLRQVEAELAHRDITGLSTTQLHRLAYSLRRQIEMLTGPVKFTSPVSELPSDEYHAQVHDWQA